MTVIQFKQKRWLAYHDQRLLKRHGEGMTDDEIAADLGFSPTTIGRKRNEHGLPPNRKARELKPWHLHRQKSGPAEKQPPAPGDGLGLMNQAKVWFGSNLEERYSGYWLRGFPVNLQQIMVAMNRERKRVGLGAIGPEHWHG